MQRFIFSPLCCLIPAALSLSLAVSVAAKEAVLSEKPIPVRMPVGQELIIKFPQPVTHVRTLPPPSARCLLLTGSCMSPRSRFSRKPAWWLKWSMGAW